MVSRVEDPALPSWKQGSSVGEGVSSSDGRPLVQEGVFIENPDVPSAVQPGANFPIALTVAIELQIVSPTNPDYCITRWLTDGVDHEIVASVDGNTRDQIRRCSKAPSRRDHQLEFRAPTSPGSYQLELAVFGADSGNLLDTFTTEFGVTEDAPGCESTGCPEGFVCSGGDCIQPEASGFIGAALSAAPWALGGGVAGVGVSAVTPVPLQAGVITGAGVGFGTKAYLDSRGIRVNPSSVLAGTALLGAGYFALSSLGDVALSDAVG